MNWFSKLGLKKTNFQRYSYKSDIGVTLLSRGHPHIKGKNLTLPQCKFEIPLGLIPFMETKERSIDAIKPILMQTYYRPAYLPLLREKD